MTLVMVSGAETRAPYHDACDGEWVIQKPEHHITMLVMVSGLSRKQSAIS